MVDEFLKKKGSKDSIEVLLNPLSLLSSPFDYEDLKKSIDFLKEKSEYGEKALLIAHEDMDGIASLIISISLLKSLNIPYEVYIPSKEEDPHGISHKVIKWGIEKDTNFLFALDCGISDVREIKYAQENGMDVLILDHHRYGHSYDSFLFIHPKKGSGFPYLSASALSLLLFYGYHILEGRDFDYIYRENPDEIILSACGILADRVPLIGDNLFIVKKAKQIIEEKRGNLYRIYNEATGKEPSLWSFVSSFSALTSREGKSLLLYLFEDGDISLKKEYLLRILKEEKLSMKLSKESLNLAKEFIDIREHFVLVVDKNIRLRSLGWIANVLKRKYYLPAVVIAYRKDGIWVGEGRSFPPISIYNAFNRIKDLFVDFGGHHYAAGFSIKQENLKFFDKKFEESIRKEKEKNWKEKVDILINGDYLHELEDILNLGKKNFYLSCYLENIKIEELRKSFGGQIYGIPAENGIYDMVLSIDENGGRVFWKSKQTE